MSDRPIVFTAGIDEVWNGDDETEVCSVVLRIGSWEVARWPVTYGVREYLGDSDEMEHFIATKLAVLFKATVSP